MNRLTNAIVLTGAVLSAGGGCAQVEQAQPVVRGLMPSQTAPQGKAPGAKVRLLAEQPSGAKDYALILYRGDEVLSAIAEFAHAYHVGNAHFTAIGAIRDPEVGWFDPGRKQYKALSLPEQMEVLTLAGDIALGEDGQPVVHAHLALGRQDGSVWGGHLLRATVSPTLELYATTYPEPLHKRFDPETDLQVIDPALGK